MSAQSTRLNTISSNIANAETVSSSIDQTYRARHPVFATVFQENLNGAQGQASLFADQDQAGKVCRSWVLLKIKVSCNRVMNPIIHQPMPMAMFFYPNVNVVEEMADMISASRAFQTNVEMMNTAKQMMQRVLSLGQ